MPPAHSHVLPGEPGPKPGAAAGGLPARPVEVPVGGRTQSVPPTLADAPAPAIRLRTPWPLLLRWKGRRGTLQSSDRKPRRLRRGNALDRLDHAAPNPGPAGARPQVKCAPRAGREAGRLGPRKGEQAPLRFARSDAD